MVFLDFFALPGMAPLRTIISLDKHTPGCKQYTKLIFRSYRLQKSEYLVSHRLQKKGEYLLGSNFSSSVWTDCTYLKLLLLTDKGQYFGFPVNTITSKWCNYKPQSIHFGDLFLKLKWCPLLFFLSKNIFIFGDLLFWLCKKNQWVKQIMLMQTEQLNLILSLRSANIYWETPLVAGTRLGTWDAVGH